MIYQGQHLLVATKHQKEQVIQPVFTQKLMAKVSVKEFDTDRLGTFTGEIARPAGPMETCILKAKQAGQQYNEPYIIANEGSFGPHPKLPFVPLGLEIMVLVDLAHDWIIVEQMVCTDSNYQTLIIDPSTKLDLILKQSKFPSHAICLQSEDRNHLIAKGINCYETLEEALHRGFKTFPKLLLSTDMRAMMNPTRMQGIGKLANKLADRILATCPSCHLPGFGQVSVKGKLPCQICHNPGHWHAQEVFACIQCPYQEEHPRQDGLSMLPSQYCEFCNP